MSTRDIPTGSLVFDIERQRFLRALGEMMHDRSLSVEDKAQQIKGTLNAIEGIVALAMLEGSA